MAIDYTGNDTSNDNKNPEGLAQNAGGPLPKFTPGRVIQQVDPSKSPYDTQTWVNRQTGEQFQATASSTHPDKLVAVNPNGNGHNDVQTLNWDINTGQKTDVGGHPWLDALKNVGMIWGGSEAAGLGALFGGGGAAANSAGSIAPQVASTAEGVTGLGIPAATTAAIPAFGTTAIAPSAISSTAAALAAPTAAATGGTAASLTGGGAGSAVAGTSGAIPGTAAGITGTGAASGMNPLLMQSLIGLGGNFLSGLNQGHMSDAQLAQQLQIAQMQNKTQNQALAQTGTQLNPYTQLQAGQKQALAQMLLAHSSPTTYTPGQVSTGDNPHLLSAGSFQGGNQDILSHLSEYLAPYQSMFTPQAAGTANADFQRTLNQNPQYQTPHSPWTGVLGSNTSDPVRPPQPTSQDYTADPSKGGIGNAGGFAKLLQDYLAKQNQFPQ